MCNDSATTAAAVDIQTQSIEAMWQITVWQNYCAVHRTELEMAEHLAETAGMHDQQSARWRREAAVWAARADTARAALRGAQLEVTEWQDFRDRLHDTRARSVRRDT